MSPKAEILAIGDELIHGSALDTNSKYIAAQLEQLGIVVKRFTVVSDDPEDLRAAIAAVCSRADVVVVTGGIGPTLDDRTREVCADVLGVGLRFDAESWDRISDWLGKRGRPVPDSNKRQAMVPEGSAVLPNDAGTAPGFAVTIDGARLFSLPGVPREMQRMLGESVIPALQAMPGLVPVAHSNLRILGPSEALLGQRLAAFMTPGRNPTVGITATGGLLTVRIVATGATVEAAKAGCEATAAELRPLLGKWLFAEGGGDLPELVLDRLRQRNHSLAVGESCTGGRVAARLVDSAGASDVFVGGVVAYSNASKTAGLGVAAELIEQHGAVSEAVATAMAEGARERFGADVAVSITGIAGPGGGSAEKPVGTVCFGLAMAGETRAWTLRIPDLGRDFIRDRAVFEVFRSLLE